MDGSKYPLQGFIHETIESKGLVLILGDLPDCLIAYLKWYQEKC